MEPGTWRHAIQGLDTRLRLPETDDRALRGLKFTDVLPRDVAHQALAARLADLPTAASVLREPVQFTTSGFTR
jgi:ATP-dependent Lhr-like helicase